MFGFEKPGKVTEHGIRVGRKDTWYADKSSRDKALKIMKKNIKSGSAVPKAIQRTKKITIRGNVKGADKCQGGSCKRNGYCRRHARQFGKNADSLYDDKGRNKNTIRWDGEKF